MTKPGGLAGAAGAALDTLRETLVMLHGAHDAAREEIETLRRQLAGREREVETLTRKLAAAQAVAAPVIDDPWCRAW